MKSGEDMITCEKFGEYNGRDVFKYTLKDKIVAEVISYGATLVSLFVPDADGKLVDVVLGYETLEQAVKSTVYFGATVGRCANRIANGKFMLNGTSYSLAQNSGTSHLHGGNVGFDSRVFDSKIEGDGVVFSLFSPDGEENYPANLNFSVKFSVKGSCLDIEYFALSDGDTLLNPTNHAYFDLSGCGRAMDTVLQIFASDYLPVSSALIPTGEVQSVFGTPFDFTVPKPVVRDISTRCEQIELAGGFDHNFCMDGNHAARAYSPQSGIVMDCYTDRCGVQFYSGNFLNGDQGKRIYQKRDAFCLETQCYPDAINHSNWVQPVLKKGEKFYSKTSYMFGGEK